MRTISFTNTLQVIISNLVMVLARNRARGILTNSENCMPIAPNLNQLFVPAEIWPTKICRVRMINSAR